MASSGRWPTATKAARRRSATPRPGRLLEAPPEDTLKGVRDRAILATLLYHGIRREELCRLRVKDMQSRQGVMHFRIKGKRDKIRFVPVHAVGAAADRGIPGARRARRRMPPAPSSGRSRTTARGEAGPAARSGFRLPQHRAALRPGSRASAPK